MWDENLVAYNMDREKDQSFKEHVIQTSLQFRPDGFLTDVTGNCFNPQC